MKSIKQISIELWCLHEVRKKAGGLDHLVAIGAMLIKSTKIMMILVLKENVMHRACGGDITNLKSLLRSQHADISAKLSYVS